MKHAYEICHNLIDLQIDLSLSQICKTILKILIKFKENKKLKPNRYKMKRLSHHNYACTIIKYKAKVYKTIRFNKMIYKCDNEFRRMREKIQCSIGDYHFI